MLSSLSFISKCCFLGTVDDTGTMTYSYYLDSANGSSIFQYQIMRVACYSTYHWFRNELR